MQQSCQGVAELETESAALFCVPPLVFKLILMLAGDVGGSWRSELEASFGELAGSSSSACNCAGALPAADTQIHRIQNQTLSMYKFSQAPRDCGGSRGSVVLDAQAWCSWTGGRP
jgi:hypothetical protein